MSGNKPEIINVAGNVVNLVIGFNVEVKTDTTRYKKAIRGVIVSLIETGAKFGGQQMSLEASTAICNTQKIL